MFKKENIRKNFLRVKQTADQKLGRSEKTEVLSDDLQTSEKRVELVKQVSTNSHKKITASLLVSSTSASDPEKRLKKMPEAGLAHSMVESAQVLSTDCIMGQMYQMCGECQSSLARTHLDYEQDVETNVLGPIQTIIETDIPNISRLKKALTKVTLDMDSAKSRWQSACRQTQTPGVNMSTAAQKVDTVREELEEAQGRVDQAKDAYTTGMFNFIAKETDHCQNLLTLLEAQSRYHEQALAIIKDVIPKMRESLTCNPTKPVYGMSLEEHLRVTNRDIATVLEACVCYLLEYGLEEEGLFRIAGMASKVKKLKASFDAGIDLDDTGDLDPHTVAGALKQYLRELPEPLLTFDKFNDFMAAAQQQGEQQRLQALWVVVDRLPKPNYDNFRYLVKFLSKLKEKSDINKMTPGNIAIVIGPNLIWSEGDSGPNMMNTGILSLITEWIVQHADWFFPGDQDFQSVQRNCAPEHQASTKPPVPMRPNPSSREVKSVAIPMTSQLVKTPHRLRSQSATGQVCTAAFSAVLGPVSGQQYSQDSSSSDSTSLSESSPQMKDYENADTLERRGSADQYATARGDLGMSSETPNSATATPTNKRSNPVITPFNPNERYKYKKASTKKSPAPAPRAESVPKELPPKQPPPGSTSLQNVHSEMYSTAFALQSLDDGGNWPSYLNTVRTMWDDKLQTNGNGGKGDSLTCKEGQGHSRSDQDINFQYSGESSSNLNMSSDSAEHYPLARTPSNQSGSSVGTPYSSPPANQEPAIANKTQVTPPGPVTPPDGSRSPSVSPASSNNNVAGAPLAESEDMQPSSIQRRQTRKPAPPPPPERPHSVAVTASLKLDSQYKTWPRQASPVVEEEPDINTREESEQTTTTLLADKPSRPNPPERISSLSSSAPHHHPDRPKVPPPVAPPKHTRSASTGAPVTIPSNQLQVSGNKNLAGSASGIQAVLTPDCS
ncbi:rho GTPase-activating protein 44-like isoform X3 [Mya arenaria]|uniref:rho GTPase-activating protein 44-like isoform X3 n=1 Tax=Mya arenaria TaxID=6604 RepID=UPI0022E994C9|nr:rho GTPase-activating protein 44-like isoform X3 [Mya arenaria]